MATKPRKPARQVPGKTPEATSDPDAVARYLQALAHPLKPELEALRKIILRADARVTEGIKWNAPSFHCGEWFATCDLRSKDGVQIIFHRGAKVKRTGAARYVKDAGGIVHWITNDRGAVRFVSRQDVAAKAPALTQVVAEWVKNLRAETRC